MNLTLPQIIAIIKIAGVIIDAFKSSETTAEGRAALVAGALAAALPQIEAAVGRDLVDDEKAKRALADAALAVVRLIEAVQSVSAAIEDAKAKAPQA